ncbi:hypothetical protein KM043_015044 [Ampulex compressa]|nr:hypothetical protein KM043_015044 [Ampulex compressa]
MEAALYAEILRKCRKSVISSELYDQSEVVEEEEEDVQEMYNVEEVAEKIVEEELPYDDVLAEKRRKYTAKEEFIYLLYNDILNAIILKWDGHFIRKKPLKAMDDDENSVEENENNESSINADDVEENNFKEIGQKFDENNAQDSGKSLNPSWKLNNPDEYADIIFINKNTYNGRISRKMMEGEGTYRWHNGVQYKVWCLLTCLLDIKRNEWNNDCWYEGDFLDGLRHGKGIMVNTENHYMYTGEWQEGRRHGKGYCRYAENDSYDGDWVMDKMEGNGLRIYPDGARYVGQWNDGVRHGIGTMAWPIGDVYRGEWKCGEMNGWPREASYVGYWRNGLRHGRGLLKLNTIGGARYSGYWKDDKKHGQGMLIGNNGEAIEADPLFLDDVLVPPNSTEKSICDDSKELKNIEQYKEKIKEQTLPSMEEPLLIQEARLTPVLKPEQFPALWYHIYRLLNPECIKTPSVHSLLSNKCYACKDNKSSKNESSFMEDPRYPFEKLEIWQFIHALLEVTWHLYTKYDNVETIGMVGKLAGGLHRLLEIDIYPNAGKHIGNLPCGYHNILPIYCMYELYCEVGYPPSARSLLRATCVMEGTKSQAKELEPHSNTVPEYFLDGINCVTVGERISYLPRKEEPLLLPKKSENTQKSEDVFAHELLAFRELGAPKMLETISKVCPSIKDIDSDVIIDMEYELTFLEFYEILIEATKKLLYLRKEKAREMERIKAELEAELARNNMQNENTSRSGVRTVNPKDPKVKKKNPVHTS